MGDLKFKEGYNQNLFNRGDSTNVSPLDTYEEQMRRWDMILANQKQVMGNQNYNNNNANNNVSGSPNNVDNLGESYLEESDPNNPETYQRSGDWHNYQIPNRTATFQDKDSDETIYSDRQYGPLNRLFRFGSFKKQTEDEFYADEEKSWNAQLAEKNASSNVTTEPPKITEPVNNQIENTDVTSNELDFNAQDDAWYKHQNGMELNDAEQAYINSLNAPSDSDPTKTNLGEDIPQPFDAKTFDPLGDNSEEHIRAMQKLIGTDVDGKWGPNSQKAYDQWQYDQKGFFQKSRQERKDDGSWYLGKKFDEMKARKAEKEYDKKNSPILVEDDVNQESYEERNPYWDDKVSEDPPPTDYSGETEATIDDIEGTSSDEFTDPKVIRQARRRDRRIDRRNRRNQRKLDRIQRRQDRRDARNTELVEDDATGESYEQPKPERDGFFSAKGKARRQARRLARKNRRQDRRIARNPELDPQGVTELTDDDYYQTSSDPALDPEGESVPSKRDLRRMERQNNPGLIRKAWKNMWKDTRAAGGEGWFKGKDKEIHKNTTPKYDSDNTYNERMRLIEDELSGTSYEEPTGESKTIYDDTNQESYEETVPFEELDPEGVSEEVIPELDPQGVSEEVIPDDYYEGESVEESFDDDYYEGESVEPGPDGGYTVDDYGNRVSEEDFYGGTSQESFDDYDYYEGESVEDSGVGSEFFDNEYTGGSRAGVSPEDKIDNVKKSFNSPIVSAMENDKESKSLDTPLDLTSQGYNADLSKGFPLDLKLKSGQVVLWKGKKMKFKGPNGAVMQGVTPGGRGNKKMWEEIK